jgi:hypothetical protein
MNADRFPVSHTRGHDKTIVPLLHKPQQQDNEPGRGNLIRVPESAGLSGDTVTSANVEGNRTKVSRRELRGGARCEVLPEAVRMVRKRFSRAVFNGHGVEQHDAPWDSATASAILSASHGAAGRGSACSGGEVPVIQ